MNKKFAIKSIISFLLAMAMASMCLFGCAPTTSGESSSNATAQASSEATTDEIVVGIEIDPTAAEGKVDLPEVDLAIISEEVVLADGASAYDALVATGAQLEGSESYVTAINGLAEKAAGSTYGWMYEVNGETPSVAANEYVLQADDNIRWYYGSWDEN